MLNCPCLSCKRKIIHPQNVIIKQPLLGFGDGIIGLMAVAGYRKQFPDSYIEYQVAPHTIPLIEMFDAGENKLSSLNDQPCTFSFEKCHSKEMKTTSRGGRYKEELGIEELCLPVLRNRAILESESSQWKGSIALAPFASSGAREYFYMPDVAKALKEKYKVVVFHNGKIGRRRIYTNQIINQPWTTVISVLLNCSLLVGVDTGLTHLAAILGVPTLILSGPIYGETVYSCYPETYYLYGGLPCDGCFWRPPHYSDKCLPCCPSLKALKPEIVVEKVNEILSLRQQN